MPDVYGHLHTDPNPAALPPPADPGWLHIGAAFTRGVPPVAGRDDLLVVVAPGAGRGSPSCFLPALATIEIDGTLLGTPPDRIDPTDPDQCPVAWGALVHEAAHARHTRWLPNPGSTVANPAAFDAALLLEESRIETAQLGRRPHDRAWLRAAVTTILLADTPTVDTRWAAAAHAALLLARADTGILDHTETTPLRAPVLHRLGLPVLHALAVIWRRAHTTADTDTTGMLNLGRRWCRILGINPDITRPPPAAQPSPVAQARTRPWSPRSPPPTPKTPNTNSSTAEPPRPAPPPPRSRRATAGGPAAPPPRCSPPSRATARRVRGPGQQHRPSGPPPAPWPARYARPPTGNGPPPCAPHPPHPGGCRCAPRCPATPSAPPGSDPTPNPGNRPPADTPPNPSCGSASAPTCPHP
ncbi:MAG: hypothetical protein L0Y54_00930 [Sporichthyaceae bacterium]|nr:hypothetical protein [Sporichthyaceae bacterium]